MLADPFAFNLKKEVRPDDFRNINWILRGPDEVREYRENALVQIKEINNKLTPLVSKWAPTLPPNSPASGVNFPLIYFLTIATAYPGNKFAYEFPKCPPLVGDIKECNVLTAKPRGASLSLDRWRRGFPARNRKVIEQLKRSARAEIALQ